MTGHRGAAALAKLGPGGMRDFGIALIIGIVGATAWNQVSHANRREWEQANREYAIKKEAKRKQFEAWLASQPYDDEAGKA